MELERERLASQERAEGARIGAKIAAENVRTETSEKIAGLKAGIEVTKSTTGLGAQ